MTAVRVAVAAGPADDDHRVRVGDIRCHPGQIAEFGVIPGQAEESDATDDRFRQRGAAAPEPAGVFPIRPGRRDRMARWHRPGTPHVHFGDRDRVSAQGTGTRAAGRPDPPVRAAVENRQCAVELHHRHRAREGLANAGIDAPTDSGFRSTRLMGSPLERHVSVWQSARMLPPMQWHLAAYPMMQAHAGRGNGPYVGFLGRRTDRHRSRRT
jgi:hypothetical protein